MYTKLQMGTDWTSFFVSVMLCNNLFLELFSYIEEMTTLLTAAEFIIIIIYSIWKLGRQRPGEFFAALADRWNSNHAPLWNIF